MRHARFVAALLAVAASACFDSGTPTSGGNGRTQVYLTDDPFPYDTVERVDLFIRSIEASATLDTTNGNSPDWVTIATPEKTFNLLDFQQGNAALAGEADIPAGQYQAVKVVINTSQSHIVFRGGAEASVQWPVPGDLALYAFVEHALDVSPQGAKIVIDFDIGRTFIQYNGGFAFLPWIRAVNDAVTGGVQGTVEGPDIEGNPTPLPNVGITVYHDDGAGALAWVVSTGRTDTLGRYAVAFLPAGSYRVLAEAPRAFAFTTASKYTTVATGVFQKVDFLLDRDTASGGPDTTGTGGGGPDTTGTGGGVGSGPVASVTLQPTAQTVSVGDSVPVLAILKNAQDQVLTGRTVTWTISDSSKVSVFGSYGPWAVLRAHASGTVTVTATSEGVSGSGTVTVR